VQADINVKPSYGLGDAQIAQMLQDSFATAEQDIRTRAVVEAQVDADRLLLAIHSALDADADLLDAPERAEIDDAMRALAEGRDSTDAAHIEALSKALAQATESFAAQRMNRGIAHALAGKNIESI
jgi:molecular chaperone HscA